MHVIISCISTVMSFVTNGTSIAFVADWMFAMLDTRIGGAT